MRIQTGNNHEQGAVGQGSRLPAPDRQDETVSEIGGTPASWHEFPSLCPSPKGRGNVESADSGLPLPLGKEWGEGEEGVAAP